jgi:hypothetical protein
MRNILHHIFLKKKKIEENKKSLNSNKYRAVIKDGVFFISSHKVTSHIARAVLKIACLTIVIAFQKGALLCRKKVIQNYGTFAHMLENQR